MNCSAVRVSCAISSTPASRIRPRPPAASASSVWTPVDQPGGKFLGDVWGHVVAPRAWTLGEAANRGGLIGCVVLRPPEPKAAPRHGHQLARS